MDYGKDRATFILNVAFTRKLMVQLLQWSQMMFQIKLPLLTNK